MSRIKNMGTATMRFKEGIICSGSAENNEALIVTGSAVILGNLSDYVMVVDNDENSSGHVMKLATDGNGSGSRVLEMENSAGVIFRARADGRFGFGPDGVDSMGAGTFVVGIDNSAHTADIAISKRLQHLGDSNTYLDFPENDNITLVAGAGNGDIVMSGSVHAPNGITGSITKAASDLEGNRLAGGIYQLDDGLIQNPHSSYSRIFFPADDTLVETVGAVSTNYKIAPFNGEIIKMQVKAIQDFTNKALTASLHVGTGTTNAYSATPSVSVALNGQAAHSVYTFDFLGRSGTTFNEGNIFGFSLELSENWAGNETIHFTSVVRFNPYA
jgi:hypothetical protein